MLDILAITTPHFFLLMGIGYVARWGGIIHREQLQGVGVRVVLRLARPGDSRADPAAR